MCQILDAALGHFAGLDARDGEGGLEVAGFGRHGAAEVHDGPGAEAVRLQVGRRCMRVRRGERDEVHAGVARERLIELGGELNRTSM
jgi:hypothetical protein